jgi:hypothetical protein
MDGDGVRLVFVADVRMGRQSTGKKCPDVVNGTESLPIG